VPPPTTRYRAATAPTGGMTGGRAKKATHLYSMLMMIISGGSEHNHGQLARQPPRGVAPPFRPPTAPTGGAAVAVELGEPRVLFVVVDQLAGAARGTGGHAVGCRAREVVMGRHAGRPLCGPSLSPCASPLCYPVRRSLVRFWKWWCHIEGWSGESHSQTPAAAAAGAGAAAAAF